MTMLQHGMAGSSQGYQIDKSLRFRSSAVAHLTRTPASTSNRQTWTWSGWVKRGSLISGTLFKTTISTTYDFFTISADALSYSLHTGTTYSYITSAVFRDPSAHYHITLAVDTTQVDAVNRVRIYVNGILQTTTAGGIPQNTSTYANTAAVVNTIGSNFGVNTHLDGYLSEINFIDGQALTPASFGQLNADGVWTPKKYTGTYGTNGFYLPFNDGTSTTSLCLDRSGNGNNWTPNNISVTAGATYDWMSDTPTNNYATLNPIYPSAANITNGNLSSGTTAARGTMNSTTFDSQWFVTAGAAAVTAGVIDDSGTTNTTSVTATKVFAFKMTTTGALSYKNVTDAGSWTSIATGLTGNRWPYSVTQAASWNFGQQPLPEALDTGFKALCTANLPAVAITNPAQHMQVKLDTGANIKTTTEAIFSGDCFEWIKDRANVNNHQLIDRVRGLSTVLQSNTTAAETAYVAPTGSSVGWTWKAGGAAVTNNAGSIASQVSANIAAGFSIVTYTGTGANATVGHGLGVAPKLMLIKRRDNVGNWIVYHTLVDGSLDYMILNTTAANANAGEALPTSSVFYVNGASADTDANGGAYAAYCFAEVPGYSKFGSYVGNGSVDGPFVYCGFRPRYVLVKPSSAVGDWRLYDSARPGWNVIGGDLKANTTAAETTAAEIDFTSNGFKLRVATAPNVSAVTCIYAAFAEHPFGGSNVSPSPAR